MKWALPHPGDSSRWVPVEDLVAELWSQVKAASALIDLQAQTLTDHDADLAEMQGTQAFHGSRIDALDASISDRFAKAEARFAALEESHATMAAELATLRERVAALEPKPANGIDVSRYQTIEQAAAQLAGKPDFCIINASTGLFATSSALATHTANSRANADVTGFYHWSQTVNSSATTPDKSDPIGEAKHFIATAKPQHGDIVALDHEEALGTWAQRASYAIAWLDYVRAQTGALPLLYINGDWLYNLWTAATPEQRQRLFGTYYVWYARPTGKPGDYGTTAKYRPETYPGVKVLVHQYATEPMDKNWCPDFDALRKVAVP